MTKFIILLLALGSFSVFYIVQSSGGGDGQVVNPHSSAAKQFWYDQKALLIEGGQTKLPLNVQIETLDYYIGDSTFESGIYYFKTILVINNSQIFIDTVVKAKDGVWGVDITDSFMGAHISTLDHYIKSYIESQNMLDSVLKPEFIWGMGDSYTVTNEEYLRELISAKLKLLEVEIISSYIEKDL
jgi:hypothetical protein